MPEPLKVDEVAPIDFDLDENFDLEDEDESLADDAGAALAEEMNNPRRVDLRDHASKVGPVVGARRSGPREEDAYDAVPARTRGIPTGPKIWKAAQLHPEFPQLRVWRIVNGASVLIGTIDAQANEEDFILFFYDSMPKPGEGRGKYKIRPVDIDGQEVLEDTYIPDIDEHNTTLKAIRKAKEEAARGDKGSNGTPTGPYALLHGTAADPTAIAGRIIDFHADKLRGDNDALHAERDRMARMQEKMAEERVDLAARAAQNVEAITERILKLESERSERQYLDAKASHDATLSQMNALHTQSNNSMQSFFIMQQQSWERERTERERAGRERERELEMRAERDRRMEELRLARETQDWERKWNREREDMERREREREKELQRQHEMRIKEMDLQLQRDREHMARVERQNENREKGESLEGMISRGMNLADQLGLKRPLQDLLATVVQGKEEPAEPAPAINWGEILKGAGPLLEGAGGFIKQIMAARAGGGMPPGMPGSVSMNPYALPGMVPGMPGMPPGMPGMPAGYLPAPGMQVAMPPGMPGMPGMPEPVAVEPPPPPPEPVPQGPQTALDLKTAKNVRMALRHLHASMMQLGPSGWEQAIMQAISNEPSIVQYLRDMNIRYAMKEAGASDEFIAQLFNHPAAVLIPADIPRG